MSSCIHWSALVLVALAGEAGAQPCEPHWSTQFVGNAPDGPVFSAASIDLGLGAALYLGGRFSNTGAVPASGIAEWRGGEWWTLGSGIPSPYNSHGYLGCCTMVKSIIRGMHNGNPAILAAGDFVIAGGMVVDSVASYRAGTWSDLAGGMGMVGCVDCPTRAYALTWFDDGSGPRMYAGGGFDLAGGVAAKGVARWDGAAWRPVGGGLAGGGPIPEYLAWVESLVVFNSGRSQYLYAGGNFGKIGAVETLGIGRWDGVNWSDVGGGLTMPAGGAIPTIKCMVVHDDGNGSALYVGGSFSAVGGVQARNIARWNGAGWSSVGVPGVGSDVNDMVLAMTVFDDGTGPALYVGGQFSDAGGLVARGLARWDGQAWSEVGQGIRGFNTPGDTPSVQVLTVHDDGSGPGLYVALQR